MDLIHYFFYYTDIKFYFKLTSRESSLGTPNPRRLHPPRGHDIVSAQLSESDVIFSR